MLHSKPMVCWCSPSQQLVLSHLCPCTSLCVTVAVRSGLGVTNHPLVQHTAPGCQSHPIPPRQESSGIPECLHLQTHHTLFLGLAMTISSPSKGSSQPGCQHGQGLSKSLWWGHVRAFGGFWHAGLVKGVPVYGRGLKLDGL